MSFTDALADTMAVVRELGLFDVRDLTPAQVEPPAVFPSALESIRPQTQSGGKVATFGLWVVFPATDESQQRKLYDAAEDIWTALEGPDGIDGRVTGFDQLGEVEVGGSSFWGGRLGVEVYY